ncbi:hypothetical protein Pyn_06694 [Prunus yedoensis var. nudiflora]|uniref:Uncharacterized protein n=1 Tax=Prunus yedoensis var. nudiflora TaxID=2094558 RepID=A0A314Z748_PRUYE|nr:hypothetical protein Pyn_06694 [Prunus yedoensis var. nudiflora]
MGLALWERESLWVPMEVRDSNGKEKVLRRRVLGGFCSFRQLDSDSVRAVAILPNYERWREWASKARKFAGFAREKACSLKVMGWFCVG